MDWLWASIDPARSHEISFAVSWHGRSMVLAWGVLAPLAVLGARYFKIMPGQDWPHVLDNQLWWRVHWIGQALVFVLTLLGFALILSSAGDWGLHKTLGYSILVLAALQIASGIFRGTKGGPTAPAADGSLRGDHYDMTPWRIGFEFLHKSLGYALLLLAAITITTGLWAANAPVWMWISLGIWWAALLTLATILQRQGLAVDTYQAIWGPDLSHPGNQRKPIGWGVRRKETQPGE